MPDIKDTKDTLTTIADGLTTMRRDISSQLSKFTNNDNLDEISKWQESKLQMDKIDALLNKIIDKTTP